MKKKFNVHLCLLGLMFLLLNSNSAIAQLSGTYTIDPKGSGSSNYKTWVNAIIDLNTNGVTGPVIFKVANGTYKEFFEIDSIVGVSAKNTVTFEAASGDSSKVILLYPHGSIASALIILNNACWVRIRKLTFKTISDSSTGLIYYRNKSSNLIFENNLFIGKQRYGAGIGGSPYTEDTNILIKNNLFKHFSYGIAVGAKTLSILDNRIDTAWTCGIQVYSSQNTLIKNKAVIPNLH